MGNESIGVELDVRHFHQVEDIADVQSWAAAAEYSLSQSRSRFLSMPSLVQHIPKLFGHSHPFGRICSNLLLLLLLLACVRVQCWFAFDGEDSSHHLCKDDGCRTIQH